MLNVLSDKSMFYSDTLVCHNR